jgi:FRG domain
MKGAPTPTTTIPPPSTFAFVSTPNKSSPFQLRLPLSPIDPRNGEITTWNQLANLFSNITFPTFADVTIDLQGDILNVDWQTNITTNGSARLPRSKASLPTEYQPLSHVANWTEFKSFVNGLDHRRYVFRGQREPLRLRTSFHRTRRADLIRFLTNDIQTLHRHLSLRTSHVFNLLIPDQNGAFFNLVQHHGYPTPLLDWTFSPFVGAFFAYRHLKNSEAVCAGDDQKVRIFVFDHREWRTRYFTNSKLTPARPHFSFLEFIAIDNERMIPQQSVSSLTNIDDIETHIRTLEAPDQEYLKIIDLPMNERPAVMRELSVMGITAGSLFPGLDGTCEELRERFFRL